MRQSARTSLDIILGGGREGLRMLVQALGEMEDGRGTAIPTVPCSDAVILLVHRMKPLSTEFHKNAIKEPTSFSL